MNECQRICQKGIVDKSFLNEELICDYKVDSKLKKIWAIELDLLNEFKGVCDKYNLQWCAYAGTLLGAIRHKGFIPWDDDLDVCMPRKDYEFLTKKCVNEFSHPYFLQTPRTDAEYAFSFAKLRNSNTCFASKAFMESSMNQGIFLDIFPLDDTDINGYTDRREKIIQLLRKCSAYMSRNNQYVFNKHTEYAKTLYFDSGENINLYDQIHKIASSSKVENSEFYSIEVCTIYSAEKNIWPKSCYKEIIEVPFCNTTMKIPVDYKTVLSIIYNNYNEFPPIDKRGHWHEGCVVDPDKSYIDIKKIFIKEIKKKI